MKKIITILFISCSFITNSTSLKDNTDAYFSAIDIEKLSNVKINQVFSLKGIGGNYKFKRIQIYTNAAKILEINGNKQKAITPSGRHFYISVNAPEKIALSFDLKNKSMFGYLHNQDQNYHFKSDLNNKYKLDFHTENKHDSFDCLNDDLNQWDLKFKEPDVPSINKYKKSNKAGSPTYQAHISVDTDNEIMWNKFQNNNATAINWIEDLFLNMNVIYESEVDMRLVIASTFLRKDTTPDGNPDFNSDPNNFNDSLNTFTNYWAANYTNVDRVQAMLLSGKDIGSFSFSGVAWVNVYCNNGFSYSWNRIGSSFSATSGALFVGHELGHNFGSSHTHCEQLANGGTDYVDHCYANEQNGCFTGTTSCPAGNGTMMSYCHAPESGFDGGGPAEGPPAASNCNTSTDIHSLIANKLSGRMVSNYPSCIKDLGFDFDLIFTNGFD